MHECKELWTLPCHLCSPNLSARVPVQGENLYGDRELADMWFPVGFQRMSRIRALKRALNALKLVHNKHCLDTGVFGTSDIWERRKLYRLRVALLIPFFSLSLAWISPSTAAYEDITSTKSFEHRRWEKRWLVNARKAI